MKTEYVSEMRITSDDVTMLEKLINAKNKGLGVNATEVCNLYDRIMGKPCRRTTCSGCLKGYITAMESRFNKWKKELELAEEADNKPVEEPKEEEVKNDTPTAKAKGTSRKTKK